MKTSGALATEFAKTKRLRVGLIVATLTVAVTSLTITSAVTNPAFSTSQHSWITLLASMGLAFPICSPLLLSVIASRQVEIEHQYNGWIFALTCGVTPGTLCRLKLLTTGAGVILATVAISLLVLVFGLLVGDGNRPPWGLWAGYTLCVLVVNLVVLALHILLAAQVQNQLISLGIGVLGTLLGVFASALPSTIAHVTPWGYYFLARVAEYQGEVLVLESPAFISITAMAVVAAVAFTAVTAFFDRQEA